MSHRFTNRKWMYSAFGLTFLKLLATFAWFFYHRVLTAAFPSVLYIYVFILSLFTSSLTLAQKLLPLIMAASVVPAAICVLLIRWNKKGASLGAFFLMLLSLADILFILVHPLTNDLLFAIGGIGLNLLIIGALTMMHVKSPRESQ